MDPDPVAWARSAPAVAVREAILTGLLGPLIAVHAHTRVEGREHLRTPGPLLLVANHCSHVDTPAILRALPGPLRRRTLVAAAADYFYGSWWLSRTVALAFGTVPVARGAAAREPDSGANLERLVEDGWTLLLFPEGTRSRDGTIGRLHSGAAVLAAAHGLPIVPVHVLGTHAAMPRGRHWMRAPRDGRWPVTVRFGAPIRPAPDEHRTEVMERVRQFFAAGGGVTTPDKRLAAQQRRRERLPS